MAEKLRFDDKDYDVDHLSDNGKLHLSKLQADLKFVTERIQELTNTHALLQRAKKSYIYTLKQEMLSDKAGFLFGDN